MAEEWKDIKGYEGKYQISNLGRVRSLPFQFIKSDGRKISLRGKLMLSFDNGRGYQAIFLNNKGKRKLHKIARLVATAFVPNPENKPEVDHIDANRANDIPSNLRWVTHKENCNHPHFIEAAKRVSIGKASKPIVQMDLEENELKEFSSVIEAANTLEVKYHSISSCLNRRTKNSIWF